MKKKFHIHWLHSEIVFESFDEALLFLTYLIDIKLFVLIFVTNRLKNMWKLYYN